MTELTDALSRKGVAGQREVESLEQKSGKDIRRYFDILGLYKGGNKQTCAVQIINWRNEKRACTLSHVTRRCTPDAQCRMEDDILKPSAASNTAR